MQLFCQHWPNMEYCVIVENVRVNMSDSITFDSLQLCKVDEWFAIYDHLMRTLFDKHAPMTSVRTKRRQAAPWYDEDGRVAKVS